MSINPVFPRRAALRRPSRYIPGRVDKRPSSTRRRRRSCGCAIALVPVIWVVYLFLTPAEPPVTLLSSAKLTLETARNAGALRYSEVAFRNAEELVKAGWMEMARQNGRMAPFRDYGTADSLLMQAIKVASDATTSVQQFLNDLQRVVHNERRICRRNWSPGNKL